MQRPAQCVRPVNNYSPCCRRGRLPSASNTDLASKVIPSACNGCCGGGGGGGGSVWVCELIRYRNNAAYSQNCQMHSFHLFKTLLHKWCISSYWTWVISYRFNFFSVEKPNRLDRLWADVWPIVLLFAACQIPSVCWLHLFCSTHNLGFAPHVKEIVKPPNTHCSLRLLGRNKALELIIAADKFHLRKRLVKYVLFFCVCLGVWEWWL